MATYRSVPGPGTYHSLTVGLVIAAVIAAVGLMPRLVNLRPFDEQVITLQIEREDSAQCEKFGFALGSSQNITCKADLGALRQGHEDLLIAHSWR